MSTWPTPQDYNEAVQNPALNFSDEELKSAVVELDALGLPRPVSGAFATVYKFQCAERTLAVRCFLRQVSDQEERYRKISDFVSNDNLPYTVHFRYLPQGIRIRGSWYPILKMEWVEGLLLNEYIEENFQDRGRMRALSQTFKQMMSALAESGVAHGDLQHGNIIVVDGELRLVDYDGMFVPQLFAHPSLELGHRNYQHPRRDETHFGPYLDNFSAWLIFQALETIAEDPELWRELEGGDERLFLGQSDLTAPYSSRILALMEHHSSSVISEGARTIRYLVEKEPQEVPRLWEALSIPDDFPALAEWSSTPEWLQSQMKAGVADATSLWSQSFARRRDPAFKEPGTVKLVVTPPKGTPSNVGATAPPVRGGPAASRSTTSTATPANPTNRFATLAPVPAQHNPPSTGQVTFDPLAGPKGFLRIVAAAWITLFISVGASAALEKNPGSAGLIVFCIAAVVGTLVAAQFRSKKGQAAFHVQKPPQRAGVLNPLPTASFMDTVLHLITSWLIAGGIQSIVSSLVPAPGVYAMISLVYLFIVSIVLSEWDLLARYQSTWLNTDYEMLRSRGRGMLIVGGLLVWILFHNIAVPSALLMFLHYRHLIAEHKKRSAGRGSSNKP